MTKNKKMLLVTLALVVLAMSNLACGGTEKVESTLTVEAVVEAQTERVENGTPCEFAFISSDVQHRLNHYQICVAADEAQEAKKAAAYQKALSECFESCDNCYPDESGSKTSDNLTCIAQCKGQ